MKKRWWAAGVIAVLLLPPVAVFPVAVWFFTAPAISPADEARLRVGMTQDEVRDLLGEPVDITGRPNDPQIWQYGGHTTAAVHLIYFNETGRLEEHFAD